MLNLLGRFLCLKREENDSWWDREEGMRKEIWDLLLWEGQLSSGPLQGLFCRC